MCFKEQWTSDPIISSVNLNRRKHKRLPLPHEVIALLLCDLKPTEGFSDGADHKKEDDHDFLYNIEIKNKLNIKKKVGGAEEPMTFLKCIYCLF